MSRTRIKICGVTRAEDAVFAAALGADAVGMVFHPPSPRAIGLDAALAIRRALPPFVSTVALFVNPDPARVREVLAALQPALLQFHGDEDEAFCARFGVDFLKVVRVGANAREADLLECASAFPSARALLFDSLVDGAYGGTGHTFDWNRIPPSLQARVVLSGGLVPGNVGTAIRLVRPWAVDVSSGVETAAKGIKDHRLMAQFIQAVHDADA